MRTFLHKEIEKDKENESGYKKRCDVGKDKLRKAKAYSFFTIIAWVIKVSLKSIRCSTEK